MLAERLDCEAPHFFVMARDGVGNAWGVYVDPELAPTRGTPWVMWEHEDDALNYVADDTERFFARLLDSCAYHHPNDPQVERVHAALVECGLQLGVPGAGPPDLLEARPVEWLPQGPLSS